MENRKIKGAVLLRGLFQGLVFTGAAVSTLMFPVIAEALEENTQEPKTMSSKQNQIDEYTVTIITKNGITRINPISNEETKVEENGDGVYEIPSDSIAIFKHADGDVAVWSAEPIENQDQFRADYLANGTDPSIKGDDIFHYYNGDGTFNWKQDIGNQWTESSTFTTNGNKTTVVIPLGKLSHLNYLTSSTPTPATPTPSDPNQTPTPSNPNQTPTPTPNTTSYPKTGYFDNKMTLREKIEVTYKTMSKEDRKAVALASGIVAIGTTAAAICSVIRYRKKKRGR